MSAENIDRALFQKIWDKTAEYLNDGEALGKELAKRNIIILQCIEEDIGREFSKELAVAHLWLFELMQKQPNELVYEIRSAIQAGYTIYIAKMKVTGVVQATASKRIVRNTFTDNVLTIVRQKEFLPEPIIISLCEFYGQVAESEYTEIFSRLSASNLADFKAVIFMATIAGYVAALLEDSEK